MTSSSSLSTVSSAVSALDDNFFKGIMVLYTGNTDNPNEFKFEKHDVEYSFISRDKYEEFIEVIKTAYNKIGITEVNTITTRIDVSFKLIGEIMKLAKNENCHGTSIEKSKGMFWGECNEAGSKENYEKIQTQLLNLTEQINDILINNIDTNSDSIINDIDNNYKMYNNQTSEIVLSTIITICNGILDIIKTMNVLTNTGNAKADLKSYNDIVNSSTFEASYNGLQTAYKDLKKTYEKKMSSMFKSSK